MLNRSLVNLTISMVLLAVITACLVLLTKCGIGPPQNPPAIWIVVSIGVLVGVLCGLAANKIRERLGL